MGSAGWEPRAGFANAGGCANFSADHVPVSALHLPVTICLIIAVCGFAEGLFSSP